MALLDMLKKGNHGEDEILDYLQNDEEGRDHLEDRADAAAHGRDKDGWTPLHWAAQDGLERLCAKLISMHVATNSEDHCGATPLMVAAFSGQIGIVDQLMKDRLTDVQHQNQYLSTAVHYAAQRGHADVIQMLVAGKAATDSCDRHGDTPLSWAARFGHIEAVKKLCELRADPLQDNNASEDSIELAMAAGHIEAAEIMRDAVGDPELVANST
eukprot:TRINITY_DN22766_c0_g1_i2.p1 TRINITY_DN22766_c0_g1~~TRINITY_DN22766_c0_g1_i2.p1  ORF type:complete len:213 (+),score=48.46 TRINITY_DN22766_c0_g1_i2:69-707(+)